MAKKKKKRETKKDIELENAIRDFFKNATPAQVREWERIAKSGK